MEIWVSIKDYENLYQVSNYGNIRSLDKKDSLGRFVKGKNMKPIVRKDGYLDITLHKDGKGKHFLLHRLIAETFIDNPNDYKEINHKDENKANNNINNLEWCSRSYNINYGIGNKSRRKTLLNKRGKEIIQYNKNKEIIKIYPSLREANRKTNINIGNICECCNGTRKTAGGYIWQYA